MANKIVIAELDIDINALLKSTGQLKAEIDRLKESQKSLTKEGDTSSKAFVQNAADLKTLQSAYNQNIKAISENTQAQADQANASKLVALALNTEVTSITEAREQNKLLNKLRNDTNVSTEEGKKQLADLNNKLDQNNEFIKENADAYLKQKINIGNYSDSIREAVANLNPLNGGMAGFTERAQEAGGAGNLLKNSLGGVVSGVWGMIKASLAFIATPIGAVIAAVALAAGILYSVFAKLDPVMDKIEQATAAVGAAFDTAKQAVMAFVTGAKSLTDAFSGLGGSMASAAKDAANLKEAQQDLNDALSSQEVTNARASQQYDELILKSKNRTLSEKERIAFIQQAQAIEENNFKQRMALSNAEIKNAIEAARIKGDLSNKELESLKRNTVAYGNYLLNAGRISQEEFDALKKAELGKIEIQSESTKRLEKSQNQEDKLNEDAQAKREKANEAAKASEEKRQAANQKLLDDRIAQSKAELDLFLSSQGIKAKSLQDQLLLNEQVYQKQLVINKKEFDATKKTEVDKLNFLTANNEAKNQLLQSNTELLIQQGERELNIIINNANKSIDEKLKAEMDYQALRLAQGEINEQQYQDAISAIQTDYDKQRQDKKLADEQKERERQTINLENERLAKQLTFEQDVEIQREQNALKLEEELLQAEKSGADTQLIKDKYALLDKRLTQSVDDFKVQNLSNTFGKVSELFGKQSQVGKTFALYQAGIDGYQSVMKAFNSQFIPGDPTSLPRAIGAGAFAGAFAAKNIDGIAGVKFEKGGIQEIGGKRHSAGGTKFYGEDGTTFEAERGEGIGVLNRSAFSSFMDFNNRFNGGSSSSGFMAGGGIITQGVRPDTQNLDFIVDAISNIPPPIVAVEEIQSVGNRYVSVKNGADL